VSRQRRNSVNSGHRRRQCLRSALWQPHIKRNKPRWHWRENGERADSIRTLIAPQTPAPPDRRTRLSKTPGGHPLTASAQELRAPPRPPPRKGWRNGRSTRDRQTTRITDCHASSRSLESPSLPAHTVKPRRRSVRLLILKLNHTADRSHDGEWKPDRQVA